MRKIAGFIVLVLWRILYEGIFAPLLVILAAMFLVVLWPMQWLFTLYDEYERKTEL